MVNFQLSCLRSPKGNRWFLSTNYDSRETSSDESAKKQHESYWCLLFMGNRFFRQHDRSKRHFIRKTQESQNVSFHYQPSVKWSLLKKTFGFCHGNAVTPWEKSSISSRKLGFQRAQQDVGPLKHLLRPVVPQLQDRQGLTDAAKKKQKWSRKR